MTEIRDVILKDATGREVGRQAGVRFDQTGRNIDEVHILPDDAAVGPVVVEAGPTPLTPHETDPDRARAYHDAVMRDALDVVRRADR